MTPDTHGVRSARKIAPRSAKADWDPRDREHDPLATILAQNEMRAQDLVPLRHGRMAASPWTSSRGAAPLRSTKPLLTALTEMQHAPAQLALVVDEYGGLDGI